LTIKNDDDSSERETLVIGERGKLVLLKARRHVYKFENFSPRKRFLCLYYINGARDYKNGHF
jgi:hypothetical protein